MNRRFAVIVGAVILIVGAVAASFAYLGSGSNGTTGGSGTPPTHTMSDGTTMTGGGGMGDGSATTTSGGSHEMEDGSTMDGMDMGN